MTAPVEVVDQVVSGLLSAIESRDPDRIEASLAPSATWQNVPHPAAEGRVAVLAMLDGILKMSDRVEWEVLSSAASDHAAFLERVDKFWIGGVEYGVPCNGVFEVDTEAAVVTGVRDYVDLGMWREKLAPVYRAWSERTAADIVQRHIYFARTGDVVGLAADYAPDALLVRGDREFKGHRQILEYFRTVPQRLGSNVLTLDSPEILDSGEVSVAWRIEAGSRELASGTDTFRTAHGWIVQQTVRLANADF